LAHWISTTPISRLANVIPAWMGLWFAVFPTVETLVAQLIAAGLVIGSYYAARHFGGRSPESAVEAGVPPAFQNSAANTAATTAETEPSSANAGRSLADQMDSRRRTGSIVATGHI
jgi:hypothetical protein